VNKSLRRALRRTDLRLSFDEAFPEVIDACAAITRRHEHGTWITRAIRRAYVRLHEEGDAHSVEVWDGSRLVGGLYGVAVGGCFCGESMFARVDDASKIAFVRLARQLHAWGYALIDCQLPVPHLERLGGVVWPRRRFLRELERIVEMPGHPAPWHFDPLPEAG
jgi:leucyl/phenylalanyl-tRNA--protein transferase